MPEIFRVEDRRDVDGDQILHVRQILVVSSAEQYFEAHRLAGEGVTRIQVATATNVGLYDLATNKVIDATEFAPNIHPYIAVFAHAPDIEAPVSQLRLDFFDAGDARLWSVDARFDAVELAILADFDRDGEIDAERPADSEWGWGSQATGAILLVNSDRDGAYPDPHFRDRLDRRVNGPLDLADMTQAALALRGNPALDLRDFTIRLHVSDAAASRLRIFDLSRPIPEPVVGPGMPIATFSAKVGERRLAVEGLDYPDAGFTGLITLTVELEINGNAIGADIAVFRVAPWLALPNTQPVESLYIADMADGSNAASIRDLQVVANAAQVELILVPPEINRRDRWLQDEIEIGYAASSAKRIPVVLDSPRNRELDEFAELMLLGEDFGYVTRGNDRQVSSLDSFGNLECTPPHSGPFGAFPFGRILYGGAHPAASQGRRMMKAVSDFVHAQEVQRPIELFSDWLNVGHIDEFMSFVPAPSTPHFRLVLAAPRRTLRMLKDLYDAGHGDLRLMEGKGTQVSVAEVVGDDALARTNMQCQRNIDWNRNVLVREMGLDANAIIEVPALYTGAGTRVDAFFPQMVNFQVVNDHIAIPKPFGPRVDQGGGARCIFETYAEQLFQPLGLNCHFVDTYEGYFLNSGEIHCGTNVVRTPFADGWWTFEPAPSSRGGPRRVIL